jgi:uncharacterized phage protein (TIGR01671 family)
MQDRYLFRGKRVDNGEWVIGNYYEGIMSELEPRIVRVIIDRGVFYHVTPKTVGQCTGLKDKNGKLIFEGDKIFDSYTNKIFIVKYVESHMTFICFTEQCLKYYNEGSNALRYLDQYACPVCNMRIKDSNVLYLNMFESYTIEIIGNVHEEGKSNVPKSNSI